MSSNGRYILFQSRADNLTQVHPILLSNGTYDNANQVYIRDTVNNTTTLVTQTYDGVQSRYGGTAESLTDDGRYIVFACSSSAYGCGFVTEGDNGLGQVYVRDMATGINTKVSINNSGVQSNALAGSGLISNDGETILFSSTADNLDTSDTSGTPNIYARNLSAQTTSRVNLSNSGADANGQITSIVTSPDDRFVAFTSQATNLVENNNSGSINVFLHDRFPAPPTPANLATLSPAQNPSLSWDAVSGADSYNIYRNGTKIGSTASTTYTDTTAPEGSDNYYVTAGNSVGESDPSNTVNILVDRTAPIPGTPVWTANPVALGNNTSFNIPATDDMSVTVDVSGVSGGEYFVGTDPGVGNATSLNWDGTNFTSNPFGADLAPGVYNVGIRAHDAAGNWSPAQVAYLVVYAPSGPGYIVGQQNLTPGSGDTLPWISTSPKDFATFGFNVKFTSIGTVDPASKFNFNYVEKGNCNSPNTPDCRSFILTANDFNWFAIGGTNSSQGSFQGTATLNINGTESNVIFRVEAIDGTQLDPSRSDNFVLKIYPEGSNAETAIPIYQVSADFTSSSGNAKGGIQIK
ncbi:MAG TPA: hypothetical protein VFW77_04240 [Candidatus Saccharimonadales bacterium]|nr:hypothetical protein [Candidatus Saccharimonadales bacterium]